jgi:hypothetical protein
MSLNFLEPEYDEHCLELAGLLAIPKERRSIFCEEYVVEIVRCMTPPSGAPLYNSVRKGNAAFEKAEHHARGLLEALGAVDEDDYPLIEEAFRMCSHDRGLFCYNGGFSLPLDLLHLLPGGTPAEVDEYVPVSISEALHPLSQALAYMVGREPDYPQVRNWRLNWILEEMHTWPERFGAVGIKDHRSATLGRAIGILSKMMPGIVPPYVSTNTIKSIWKPRPRKRGRK